MECKNQISISDVHQMYIEITRGLMAEGKTVSTMESCTSGLIATLLTNIDGSSAVLQAGKITYSNAEKIKAGVPAKVIEMHGVYSMQTAIEMAKACQKSSNACIGVGVTGTLGWADPNNADSKPGEVYFAIACNEINRGFHCFVTGQATRMDAKYCVAMLVAEQLRKFCLEV